MSPMGFWLATSMTLRADPVNVLAAPNTDVLRRNADRSYSTPVAMFDSSVSQGLRRSASRFFLLARLRVLTGLRLPTSRKDTAVVGMVSALPGLVPGFHRGLPPPWFSA